MKIANTTAEIARFFPAHADRARCLYEAGFTGIDLSFFRENRPDSRFLLPDWKEEVASLLRFRDETGVSFVQSHLPSADPLRDEGLLAKNIRCVEVCGMLDIPLAVIHAGALPGMGKEEFFEANAAFVRKLLPTLEANNVTLCLENSASCYRKGYYYFFTGASLAEFCEYFNHPLVQACWDTGHANLEGPQYQQILDLGKHMKAIHFNDNYGVIDDHILPFMGTMNVDAVMHALQEIGFDGPMTLECDGQLRPANSGLSSRRPFPTDTRLADPPLVVVKSHLRNSLETVRAVLEAYGIPAE